MYNASGSSGFTGGKGRRPTASNSDYAVSSGQLQSRYVVRKISGMLGGLHEIGETSKSNENFKDLARKGCYDGRRFSDDCHYSLCVRTLDRNEVRCNGCSHVSDNGAFCEICTAYSLVNGTHLKFADQMVLFDSGTLHSLTVTDCSILSPNETVIEKFCRICHSFGSSEDPLISPCRCTGSLKYVHISCLLHWLTICAHKLKRPAICELCLYKYRLRNIIDWQNLRLPSISRYDLRYLIVFIIAATLMFLTSITSLICFCIEKNLERNNNTMQDNPETITKGNYGKWETLFNSYTFLPAFLFLLSIFVAIYAHFKTNTSLIRYLYRLWINNQNWIIEEYRPSRDQRYCHKMEELRRRLNDEVTQNYGTEGGASGEVVCSRGGAKGRKAGNSTPSPRDVLLRSSSLLSSPAGFNSAIVQGTSIDTITSNVPRYIISATVATPATV
ncbi:RING-variant domain family protein [Brugia pahangi]